MTPVSGKRGSSFIRKELKAAKENTQGKDLRYPLLSTAVIFHDKPLILPVFVNR